MDQTGLREYNDIPILKQKFRITTYHETTGEVRYYFPVDGSSFADFIAYFSTVGIRYKQHSDIVDNVYWFTLTVTL